MAIYEFQCEDGHKVEILCKSSSSEVRTFNEIICPGEDNLFISEEELLEKIEIFIDRCLKPAERIWSSFNTCKVGKPTIVFVNPQTGRAQVATSYADQAPPGYVKHELKGLHEREQFERTQNAINKRDDDAYNEARYNERDETRKAIIDNAQSHLSIDAAASDNSNHTELLMKAAIERIRKKPVIRKERKTDFRFDVNYKDASSMKDSGRK